MTNKMKNTPEGGDLDQVPVLMLMGSQCIHCEPMMQVLTALVKQGLISELRIVNIEKQPEIAAEYGVRGVPWLKIGLYELAGSRNKDEIIDWIKRASSFEGVNDYFTEVLTEGNIDLARKLIRQYPPALNNVIALMTDADAKINVRLGVGVLIEELAETDKFKAYVPQLIVYLSHEDARVRSDACHYLSLTQDREHLVVIEPLLNDSSEEVREIAADAIELLTGNDA